MLFKEVGDKWNGSYFSVDLTGTNFVNASWFLSNDIGPLLNPVINISTRATGPFSDDLTARDDVLLAFLSLLLLLVIEGLVTTLLLRTKQGTVSNFGFSVKQIVALIQEFNFSGIFKGRKVEKAKRKINYKLIVFAVSIISTTFLLEVAVLFLTNPILRDVTNKTATFRLTQPVVPDWHNVRYHIGRSIDKPCEAFKIFGVEQGQTRMNGCVSASISGEDVEMFVEEKAEDTTAEITSQLHEYGAEHSVKIHDKTAKYSMRAYFTLSDGETRVMRVEKQSPHEAEQISILHRQYIAYLLSVYRDMTKDKRVTLESINQLLIEKMESKKGPRVNVLWLPGPQLAVETRSYTTRVQGLLPYGLSALRLAQHTFRGGAAVKVSEANLTDLTIENGVRRGEAVVWQEQVRTVNWLSLTLILVGSMGVLAGLRWAMRPVATAEIAGVLVKKAVGADAQRAPVELDDEERKVFRVADAEEDEYRYGAETAEGWARATREYNDRAV